MASGGKRVEFRPDGPSHLAEVRLTEVHLTEVHLTETCTPYCKVAGFLEQF